MAGQQNQATYRAGSTGTAAASGPAFSITVSVLPPRRARRPHGAAIKSALPLPSPQRMLHICITYF